MTLIIELTEEMDTEISCPVPAAQAQNVQLWCPTCSSELEEQRCKLICRKCGYYMSCADYY